MTMLISDPAILRSSSLTSGGRRHRAGNQKQEGAELQTYSTTKPAGETGD